jgi:hypothetical protein
MPAVGRLLHMVRLIFVRLMLNSTPKDNCAYLAPPELEISYIVFTAVMKKVNIINFCLLNFLFHLQSWPKIYRRTIFNSFLNKICHNCDSQSY